MEKGEVPGFFAKRKVLEGDQTPGESLTRQGLELAEQGLLDEALNYFVRARNREGMEKVLEKSRREGDTFSFEAAVRALGREVSREEWEQLAERALERGLLWFSYRAFERADHQPGLEKVRTVMAEQGLTPPA